MPRVSIEAPRATRAPRSDAAVNRERVLAAAAIAIRREGERVPMATIADDAGVGIGTVYRHYPTRTELLDALTLRSYRIVLNNARTAAESAKPPVQALEEFFERTIACREDLILPLHGGPVSLEAPAVALRTEISDLIEHVLRRGRRDRSIRSDATAVDVIITGALLAQPLPHVANWDQLARRQARIYLAGLATTGGVSLPGRKPTRAQLEAGFARGQRA